MGPGSGVDKVGAVRRQWVGAWIAGRQGVGLPRGRVGGGLRVVLDHMGRLTHGGGGGQLRNMGRGRPVGDRHGWDVGRGSHYPALLWLGGRGRPAPSNLNYKAHGGGSHGKDATYPTANGCIRFSLNTSRTNQVIP